MQSSGQQGTSSRVSLDSRQLQSSQQAVLSSKRLPEGGLPECAWTGV